MRLLAKLALTFLTVLLVLATAIPLGALPRPTCTDDNCTILNGCSGHPCEVGR